MHLDAFSASPSKHRRRRQTRTAASASPPHKMPAVTSPPARVASPSLKAASQGRSAPAIPARKHSSPTKEVPKQRLVMDEVRILRRGEEPPAPSPPPVPVVAQAAPADRRVPRGTGRIVPTKIRSIAAAAGYAGPAFSSASPEPSSLPYPVFIRRAEAEATRGLRCLLRIGELT
ncbi:hypothetical protein GUJ93_ZPchr0002g26759 [Zizania palustris]|uniref:Uncharacterized protein n=1 Tax=Zizania palustris TaxID=103762 RepID=A0A8J5S8E7_ZIZPA|nr:hypothetical protein GUJ93_ZPchr0002g26759 [Zizania palustris]